MGDRISFSFVNGDWESVTYFAHWLGRRLLSTVDEYYQQLISVLSDRKEGEGYINYPIDRLEPGTVMVDFIRWHHKDDKLVESSFYLGKDKNDGDNSDNGHWVFDLDKGKWKY